MCVSRSLPHKSSRAQQLDFRGYTSFGSRLIKQTYSVYVETPTGRRKWHLG